MLRESVLCMSPWLQEYRLVTQGPSDIQKEGASRRQVLVWSKESGFPVCLSLCSRRALGRSRLVCLCHWLTYLSNFTQASCSCGVDICRFWWSPPSSRAQSFCFYIPSAWSASLSFWVKGRQAEGWVCTCHVSLQQNDARKGGGFVLNHSVTYLRAGNHIYKSGFPGHCLKIRSLVVERTPNWEQFRSEHRIHLEFGF